MSRVIDFTIDGETYPLLFALNTAKTFTERYGELDKIEEMLASKDYSAAFDMLLGMLSLMIDHGTKYYKYKGIATPEPIGEDMLGLLIDFDQASDLMRIVSTVMRIGQAPEVELEPIENEKNSKNAKTT